MPQKLDTIEKVLDKLKSKTVYNENGCWLYTGSQDNDGHSTIRFKYKSVGIHRFSMHVFYNFDLDTKLPVCHKPECNTPNCWNPEHLYVGSATSNVLDTIRAQTNHYLSKTHCPSGHEYSEANTYIDPQEHRHCRECAKLKMRRRRE